MTINEHRDPPLVLTLLLDEASFAFFNAKRSQYFPPERNFINAHLTLFHALPNTEQVVEQIHRIASVTPSFSLLVDGIMPLGFGNAFSITSDALRTLHHSLREQWSDVLTRQDQQKFRPHITIQNKVSPVEARALYQALTDSFQPFEVAALGLSIFEYRGGPWEKVADIAFCC